jgi:hypothetical protein
MAVTSNPMKGITTMTITEKNINDFTLNGKWDIAASIKNSDNESKTVKLRFVLNGTPLKDVLTFALADRRIAWANGGSGRSKWSSYTSNQVIEVNFSAPGAKIETREDHIKRYISLGFAREVAEFAVDHPEQFAEVVNKNVKTTNE